jgi:hypothetical protein
MMPAKLFSAASALRLSTLSSCGGMITTRLPPPIPASALWQQAKETGEDEDERRDQRAGIVGRQDVSPSFPAHARQVVRRLRQVQKAGHPSLGCCGRVRKATGSTFVRLVSRMAVGGSANADALEQPISPALLISRVQG